MTLDELKQLKPGDVVYYPYVNAHKDSNNLYKYYRATIAELIIDKELKGFEGVYVKLVKENKFVLPSLEYILKMKTKDQYITYLLDHLNYYNTCVEEYTNLRDYVVNLIYSVNKQN